MQDMRTKDLTGDERFVDVVADELDVGPLADEVFGDLTVNDVKSIQYSVFDALCKTPVRAQPSDFGAIGSVHQSPQGYPLLCSWGRNCGKHRRIVACLIPRLGLE